MIEPLTLKDKIKAKRLLAEHLLAEDKIQADGRTRIVGEECDPGLKGYVDVGIFNGCQSSNHVCVEASSSSSLGGTCMYLACGTKGTTFGSFESTKVRGGDGHRHLAKCVSQWYSRC
jgi:hypothetical protein